MRAILAVLLPLASLLPTHALAQNLPQDARQAAILIISTSRSWADPRAACGGDGIQCKEMKIVAGKLLPVSSADKANGISAKAQAAITYIHRAQNAPWEEACKMVCITKRADGKWTLKQMEHHCTTPKLAFFEC